MTDQARTPERTPNPVDVSASYPTGPLEDPPGPSFWATGDPEPGYRVVASRRVLSADPLSIIRRFHRAPDGHVVFASREDFARGGILGSSAVAELEDTFPGFAPGLQADSYFSINAFYRKGTLKSKYLRYLNALYADIDFHSPEFSVPRPERMNEADARAEGSKPWTKALSAVWEAQDARVIPPASLLSMSGRGMWLFYLLVDPETNLPPRAFNEKVALYGAINRELHSRLQKFSAYLHADPQAVDASRCTRVPGSLHQGVNRKVEYLVQNDDRGRGFVYTLREMAESMGLDSKGGTRPAGKSGRRMPANRAGWEGRWAVLLDDLSTLERIREGFGEGCRSHALWVTAYALRKLGRDDSSIEAEVLRRAATCRPPFPVVALRAQGLGRLHAG